MSNTFRMCADLRSAPTIPSTVIEMVMTFYGGSSLVEAPVIPSLVENMNFTFAKCAKLSNNVMINSAVVTAVDCFEDVTNEITVKVPKDSTTYTIFNEKYGTSSNIHIETF